MKILIFSSLFPPDIGGVQNVTYNLAQQFKSSGHDVTVLSSVRLGELIENRDGLSKIISFFKVSKPQYIYKDLKVKRIFMSLPRTFMGYLSFPYRFVTSVFLIFVFIKKIKPSIINFHFPDDSLYYFYAVSRLIKLPYIVNIHGNELHVFSKNKFYKRILAKVILKAKKVIVNSEYMKRTLLKIFSSIEESKIVIINNGLNLSKFNNLENKQISLKKDSYFLYVGRLDYKKGIDVLIEVYNKIGHKLSRDLVIVGGSSVGNTQDGGVKLEEYQKMATSTKIKFEGWVDPNVIPYYFKNAYFSIFPSRNEPFGLVGLESMASGTPIIASSGGFKEIINATEGGIYFKPNSKAQLEKLLLKVDANSKIKEVLAKKALEGVVNFDWGSKSLEYLKAFEESKNI